MHMPRTLQGWVVLGGLGVGLSLLTGCGSPSSEPGANGAGRTGSQVQLALRLALAPPEAAQPQRQQEAPGASRQLRPGDPGFVTQIVVRVQAPDFTPPIEQTIPLGSTQQAEVSTVLVVPSGLQRQIRVAALNATGLTVFQGDTSVDLVPTTRPVEVALPLRQTVVSVAATSTSLANRTFTFLVGTVFGTREAVSLAIGTFADQRAPFTLSTAQASGRGVLTLGSCDFQFTGTPPLGLPTTFRLDPCTLTVRDSRMTGTNVVTGVTATSEVPTAPFVLDASPLDAVAQSL